MKIECYIVINRSGSLRIYKMKPKLGSDEIAVRLNLTIPRSFFERLIPTADLIIPDEYAPKQDIEFITKLNSQKIAESLNLEADKVEDGLKQLLEEKFNSDNMANANN